LGNVEKNYKKIAHWVAPYTTIKTKKSKKIKISKKTPLCKNRAKKDFA